MINKAASNTDGTVSIWLANEENIGHSTIIDGLAVSEGHKLEAVVNCEKLITMIPEQKLFAARIVKMDIEGAERMALEGIQSQIARFSTATEWIVELSTKFSPLGSIDTKWIFELFTNAGYRAFKIQNVYGSYVDPRTLLPVPICEIYERPDEDLTDILFSKCRK